VLRLNDDANARSIRDGLNGLGDLFGEILLDLEPPGIHINNASDLA
jgi:hypothetical protein